MDIGKLWNQYYQFYLDHYAPDDFSKEEGLPYLRDKLFISILLLTVPIGFLAYVPGMIVSVTTKQLVIGAFDTIALIVVLLIYFHKNQSINAKKIWFSVNFYMLTTVLIVYLGLKGPGIIILLCISVWITLYHSRKAGLMSVVLNAALFALLLLDIPHGSIFLPLFEQNKIPTSIAIGLNFVAFNALLVFSVASLVDQLNQSLIKERNLQRLLKSESKDLLAAKQKAEESDRLKSAFLANMSHEIRTPMNGILGFSELLSEHGLDNAEQQEYIRIIRKSGVRLLNIISEIIDISRIEAGEVRLTVMATNINEFSGDIHTLLKPDADSKGINLIYVNSLLNNELVVNTDREKLFGILTNLVKNAIKFTDEGAVEFGYTFMDSNAAKSRTPTGTVIDGALREKQKTMLTFFVRDTGIGIPHDRQEAIFERFIQADIADIQARQGAGLGLYIARSYVGMLGGTIWVESVPGKGSVFYFTLPDLV
jgi:signal transduction histidine kinase